MPDLTPEEVERFVALGKLGWDLYRNGEAEGASQAFRAQLAIFSGNPEPYVSLALLAADQGSKKEAVSYLRDAMLRGFTDLGRVDRAEVWQPIKGYMPYLKLQDALPLLVDVKRDWAGWDAFAVPSAPESLDVVLAARERGAGRIERMAPALGQELTELWDRLIDRVTAAMLEAYIDGRPQAPDLADALDRLMKIYAGGPLQHWTVMPEDPAKKLTSVSELVLERFPKSAMRPAALVGLALAKNTERNSRGVLNPDAVQTILTSLDEVVTRFEDSPLAATAAVGLLRTEFDAGHSDRAAARYDRIREARSGDPQTLQRIQDGLGELALRLGGLPEFRTTTLDGTPFGAEQLRGKVAVLDFWATWCQPCVNEFPTLRKIHERYEDDVVLLGVNLDYAEDLAREELSAWVASQRVPGSQVHDGLSWDSELVKSFGVKEIPFNVVVGPDGTVLAVNEHGKRLEKAVRAAVRSQSGS